MRARRSTLSSAGRAVTAFIRPYSTAGANSGKGSSGECVAYPLDPRRLEAVEEHNIEPAGRFLLVRKVVACRGDDPRLLARVDAVGGAAEVLGASQPDFGKNDGIPIPQD